MESYWLCHSVANMILVDLKLRCSVYPVFCRLHPKKAKAYSPAGEEELVAAFSVRFHVPIYKWMTGVANNVMYQYWTYGQLVLLRSITCVLISKIFVTNVTKNLRNITSCFRMLRKVSLSDTEHSCSHDRFSRCHDYSRGWLGWWPLTWSFFALWWLFARMARGWRQCVRSFHNLMIMIVDANVFSG